MGGNSGKSPLKDRRSLSSGLPRWGQPPCAGEGAQGQLLQDASLPHSFPRTRSWEVWRRLATFGCAIFGNRVLVSGSRGQGDWERAVCISSGPGLPPARTQGGQGHLLCLLYELFLPSLGPPAFLSVRSSNTPEGPPGALLYPFQDVTQSLAPGPPSGLLAVTGGRNNPSNPVICTGLSSRPSPPVCALS